MRMIEAASRQQSHAHLPSPMHDEIQAAGIRPGHGPPPALRPAPTHSSDHANPISIAMPNVVHRGCKASPLIDQICYRSAVHTYDKRICH